MGWYTELKIGKKYWSWRKNLPSEVLMLFYGKHKTIGKDLIDLLEDAEENNSFVGIEGTVAQIISNLDNLGLTLDFFISTYASYRYVVTNWGLGILRSRVFVHEHGDMEDSYDEDGKARAKEYLRRNKEAIKRIEKSSASKDFHAATKILKDGIKLKSNLMYDEAIIPSFDNLDFTIDFTKNDIIEATTFGMFLEYAHENLPEIAWLFEIRIILETVSSRSKVKLDLKEWVEEGLSLDIINGSINMLGLKAKTYSRTFDAILGGQDTYNKEYERVILLKQWKELTRLDKDDISKGSKLEIFFASLFHKKFGFDVIKKNLLTETQELDIVLKNVSTNEFVKSLNSPFILVECKNWTNAVGAAEARVFESKYREAGRKVNLGIFVAINGVSKPFKSLLNNLVRDGVNVIVIDNNDIEQFLYSEELDIGLWLENLIADQFFHK